MPKEFGSATFHGIQRTLALPLRAVFLNIAPEMQMMKFAPNKKVACPFVLLHKGEDTALLYHSEVSVCLGTEPKIWNDEFHTLLSRIRSRTEDGESDQLIREKMMRGWCSGTKGERVIMASFVETLEKISSPPLSSKKLQIFSQFDCDLQTEIPSEETTIRSLIKSTTDPFFAAFSGF